jgi:6-phosphogluconolactonase (cycloisomerase 2 family)
VIRAGDVPASIDAFVSPIIATPAVFVPTFAYLSHRHARSISSYTIDAGTGLPQPSGITPSSTSAYALALSSDGRFLYSSEAVDPEGPANISTYSIDPATGALAASQIGTVATPVRALDLAADPSGRFVYASNHVDGAVSAYTRDVDTGALTPNGDPIPTIAEPFRLAIDPTGRNLYVLSTQQLQVFAIDSRSGTLRAGAISRIGQPDTPVLATNLALEPGGKFLYVLNVDGSIEMYPIDARSGALGPVSTIQTERGYAVLAVEPSGRFLYAGNQLSLDESILVYSIAQDTGVLTMVGSVNLPEDPRLLATEISGKYLYAELFNDTIVTFAIDQYTGALTTIASSPGAATAGETRSFVTMGTVQ